MNYMMQGLKNRHTDIRLYTYFAAELLCSICVFLKFLKTKKLTYINRLFVDRHL